MNFLGDIGGILGLFLGFSIMTIIEFVELTVDLAVLGTLWIFNRDKWRHQTGSREQIIMPCPKLQLEDCAESDFGLSSDYDKKETAVDGELRDTPQGLPAPYYKRRFRKPARNKLSSCNINPNSSGIAEALKKTPPNTLLRPEAAYRDTMHMECDDSFRENNIASASSLTRFRYQMKHLRKYSLPGVEQIRRPSLEYV